MKTEVRLNKDQSTLDALGSTKGKPALLSPLWMQTRAHSRQQVNYLRSSNDTLTCVNSVIYSLGNYVTSKMYLSVRSLLIWKKVISNLGLKKNKQKTNNKTQGKTLNLIFHPKRSAREMIRSPFLTAWLTLLYPLLGKQTLHNSSRRTAGHYGILRRLIYVLNDLLPTQFAD